MWTLLVTLAFAQDPGPWQAVLDRYVTAEGRVDYAGIKAANAVDPYLQSLAAAAEPTNPGEKIAFWLNAYNALTVDLVADHYPLSSIRDLDGGKVWDTRSFVVAGRPVTLNEIEQNILRPMGDPRVHAALNCASLGCPPLQKQAYAASTLDRQLVAAATQWMATNGISVDMAGRKVKLNRIFEWYAGDFRGMNYKDIPGVDNKLDGALDFAARYLPADQAAWLRKGGYSVSFSEYDWGLNKN